MKVRRKPIVLDAEQLSPTHIPAGVQAYNSGTGYIQTLEGLHEVKDGYWIITGITGEQWGVRPDIFAATYEVLE